MPHLQCHILLSKCCWISLHFTHHQWLKLHVLKMKCKTNFSSHLQADTVWWLDVTDYDHTPLFYDRFTPLVIGLIVCAVSDVSGDKTSTEASSSFDYSWLVGAISAAATVILAIVGVLRCWQSRRRREGLLEFSVHIFLSFFPPLRRFYSRSRLSYPLVVDIFRRNFSGGRDGGL